MHYSCMLVSRVRQPCSLVVLPTFRVRRTQPHTSRCNVSFGLAVGEGVLDLRLPSASRIPDYYVVPIVDPVLLLPLLFGPCSGYCINSKRPYWTRIGCEEYATRYMLLDFITEFGVAEMSNGLKKDNDSNYADNAGRC